MKITMLTVLLAINFAMEQESPAFVDCGYGALYYSEELPEDGAVPDYQIGGPPADERHVELTLFFHPI